MPITDEELDDLMRTLSAGAPAEAPPRPKPPVTPLPPKRTPKPGEAAGELQSAVTARETAKGVPERVVAERALEARQQFAPPPRELGEDITLREQAARALSPKLEVVDERGRRRPARPDPGEPARRARATATVLLDLLAPVPDAVKHPFIESLTGIKPTSGQETMSQMKEAVFGESPPHLEDLIRQLPAEERELRAENSMMALLRIMFGAAPSLIVEGAASLPTLAPEGEARENRQKVKEIAERALKGELDFVGVWDELLDDVYGEGTKSLGEVAFGVTNQERGFRIDRTDEGVIRDALQRTLEKVEDGTGLAEDLETSFVKRFGDSDAARWGGWSLGFMLDVFTNWEGAAAKAIGTPARVAGKVQALKEIAPAAGTALDEAPGVFQRIIDLAARSEMDYGAYYGKRYGEALQQGVATLDDLPEVLRIRAEEVAQTRYGMTLEELARRDGLDVPAREAGEVAPPARAAQEAAEEALVPAAPRPKAGEGVPGEDPGAFGARRARMVEGPDLLTAARKKAPFKADSVEDFFDQMRGADPRSIQEGAGFRALEHLDEGQTAASKAYVLRNHRGEEVGFGTFPEMVERKLKRQLDGDEVWFRDHRRVTTWSARDEPSLRASHMFASAEERALVKQAFEKDPRARPSLIETPTGTATVGGTLVKPAHAIEGLVDAVNDMPVRRFAKLTDADVTVADVVQDAARLWAVDRLGSHLLVTLPNGAVVTKREAKTIRRRTGEALSRAGLPGNEVASAVAKRTALSEVQQGEVRRIADEARVDVNEWLDEGGVLSPEGWRRLRWHVLEQVGGAAADARFHIRGARQLSERVLGVLNRAHDDPRTMRRAGDAALSKFGALTKGFFDAPRNRLAKRQREIMRQLEAEVAGTRDDVAARVRDVFREMRESGVSNPQLGAILHQITPHFKPVTARQASLARDLAQPGAVRTVDRLIEVRDQIAASLPPRARPSWTKLDDPEVLALRIGQWSDATTHQQTVLARRFLVSATPAKATDPVLKLAADPDHLDQAKLLELYDEVFLQGELKGPVLEQLSRELTGAPADGERAMLEFVVRNEVSGRMDRAVRRMVGAGIAVWADDPRANVLTAVALNEEARRVNGTRVLAYGESTMAWANVQLSRWGMGLDDVASLEPVKGVTVPPALARDLEAMERAGLLDTRQIFKLKTLDAGFRYFKKWTTHGFLMPNPPYFMGQMLSIPMTLVTTRGYQQALAAGFTFMRNFRFVGQLVRRTARGHPWFRPLLPGEAVIRTVDDEIYTLDEVVQIALRAGLDESAVRVESAAQIGQVLLRESRGILDPRKLVANWQVFLEDWASAFDQAARYSVLVERLKAGESVEAATTAAREAALDFNDLTAFERGYMRKVITFYAFMRKNSDAYIKAFLDHPQRFFSQGRLAHEAVLNAFTDRELTRTDEQALGRKTVFQTGDITRGGGHILPGYRALALQSTPLGIVEFLATIRLFLPPLPEPASWAGGTLFSEEGLNPESVQQLNPVVGEGLLLTARQGGLGFSIDSHHANRIPTWLAEGPWGPWVLDAFDADAVSLRPWEDPLLASPGASDAMPGAKPGGAVWVAGANSLNPTGRRLAWQSLRLWIGRPMSTLEQLARAGGVGERPEVPQAYELFSFLSGLRWTPVADEGEVRRRQLEDRERATRDAAREVSTTLPPEYRP